MRAGALSLKLQAGDAASYFGTLGRLVEIALHFPKASVIWWGNEDIADLWKGKLNSTLNSLDDGDFKERFVSGMGKMHETDIKHVSVQELQGRVRKLGNNRAVE